MKQTWYSNWELIIESEGAIFTEFWNFLRRSSPEKMVAGGGRRGGGWIWVLGRLRLGLKNSMVVVLQAGSSQAERKRQLQVQDVRQSSYRALNMAFWFRFQWYSCPDHMFKVPEATWTSCFRFWVRKLRGLRERKWGRERGRAWEKREVWSGLRWKESASD